jgi:hypothetical protein
MKVWIPVAQRRPAPEVDAGLFRAVRVAARAPSVHNTRPWRWRIGGGTLELWADRDRQLRVADPAGRLLTISCGAALHHALVALAVQGQMASVLPLPDPARPDLLARVMVTGVAPITTATIRTYDAIGLRHTDRRRVAGRPMDESTMLAIANAAWPHGAFLRFLAPYKVASLAGLVAAADRAEAADPACQAELGAWMSGGRGTMPAPDPGSAPVYAVLYGAEDTPAGWLRAGRALSAAWLMADELDVSVAPISSVIEVSATRRALRELLSTTSWPYLVLRMGLSPGPVVTSRLPSPGR